MAIRLDILLIFGISIVVLWGFLGDLNSTKKRVKKETPELVFTNTNFTDVNRTHILSNSFARKGKRVNGILSATEILYRTDTINYMQANRGHYEGEKLFLRGDVFIDQKEGHDYKTDFAIYDTISRKIDVPSEFETIEFNNTVRGKSMVYDLDKEEVQSEGVKALFHIKEK
jgi:negative regulator of replication initiation